MNGPVQLVGLAMSIIALALTMASTFMPEWRRNDPKDEIIESVIRHQGIWLRCLAYSTGQWQCDDYDAFFLGLPVQLQTARGLAMMCGSFYVESEDGDYWKENRVGRGVRRMRESFRESFRPVSTNNKRNVDYV